MRWTLALAAFVVLSASTLAQRGQQTMTTFTKDVAPIFHKHCVSCHRPGEAAPMSLLTYEQARPYAKAILSVVSNGTMPPWHADAPAGTFQNERILTEVERQTIRDWVDGGAPRGHGESAPSPVFTDGWRIGTPDVVFEMPFDYEVKASGKIDYEYIYIPTNFTEAKWVTAIEVRPGNRRVVHHANLYYRAIPDSARALARANPKNIVTGARREPNTALYASRTDLEDRPRRNIAHYAPGTNPQVAPEGMAYRLEAGGILELQMHYSTIGEATTDRTRVGLIFSDDPTPRELYIQTFYNNNFTLPAASPDVAISTDLEFLADAKVWGVWPHTHVRGKRWQYDLMMPDGTTKIVLSVPRYDFDWQTYYMYATPLRVAKGAKIVSTAWYDNSPANKNNPDPTVDVPSGLQTWEEMQYTSVLLSEP